MAEYWFRPKRRGIGAGVPLNWKGWAWFGCYVMAVISVPGAWQLAIGYSGTVLQRLLTVAAISVPFVLVAWKKTEGGWRWRNDDDGEDDAERA